MDDAECVHPVHQVHPAHLDRVVHKELAVQTVVPVPLATQVDPVVPENLEREATKGNLATLDHLACPAKTELREAKDSQDHEARTDHLAPKVVLDHLAVKPTEDSLATLDLRDLLANPDHLAKLVDPDHLAQWAHLERTPNTAHARAEASRQPAGWSFMACTWSGTKNTVDLFVLFAHTYYYCILMERQET